jgi:hypothetical protein
MPMACPTFIEDYCFYSNSQIMKVVQLRNRLQATSTTSFQTCFSNIIIDPRQFKSCYVKKKHKLYEQLTAETLSHIYKLKHSKYIFTHNLIYVHLYQITTGDTNGPDHEIDL